MKKTDFHSAKFQKAFYDSLSQQDRDHSGFLSCGYAERYNPRLIVDNTKAFLLLSNIFRNSLGEHNRCTILDICTGTGMHLPALCQYGKQVIGADISFGLLTKAQQLKHELSLNNASILQSEAEQLPFRQDCFDAIVMIDAIHHVEQQEAVIKELQRVAKRNAPFLLIEPNIANPLVFLAHCIPKEERGALRSNTSKRLEKLLCNYMNNIAIEPFNYIASRKPNILGRLIYRFIESMFKSILIFWPIRYIIRGNFAKPNNL